MVVERSANSLATAVSEYFSLSLQEKQKLSKAAQERGEGFDDDSRKSKFGEEFKSLIKQLQSM
jgi:hypothetical protein